MDRLARRVHLGSRELVLKPREFDLLSFLLANRDQVHSVRAILGHVWGQRMTSDSSKTVAVHVRWLRQKLDGQADVTIATVRGAGYRLDVRSDGAGPSQRLQAGAPNS